MGMVKQFHPFIHLYLVSSIENPPNIQTLRLFLFHCTPSYLYLCSLFTLLNCIFHPTARYALMHHLLPHFSHQSIDMSRGSGSLLLLVKLLYRLHELFTFLLLLYYTALTLPDSQFPCE